MIASTFEAGSVCQHRCLQGSLWPARPLSQRSGQAHRVRVFGSRTHEEVGNSPVPHAGSRQRKPAGLSAGPFGHEEGVDMSAGATL